MQQMTLRAKSVTFGDMASRRNRDELRNHPEIRMAKLMAAIKRGDAYTVQRLIGLDTSLSQLINAEDSYGMMPLHNAVRFDQVETAIQLIELGADVNVRNRSLNTPLHVACEYGQVRSAQMLIYFGGSVMVRGVWSRTPLHYAAAEGHSECIKLLLKHGASALAKTSTDGDFANTPLHLAGWFGKVSSIETLLSPDLWSDATYEVLREKKNCHRNTPLHLAAFTGQLEAARCLLEKGANITARGKQGRNPIHFAAVKGKADVVRLLLDHGASVKAKSGPSFPDFQQTAIHLAAYYGHLDVIKVVLERDPNMINMRSHAHGQTPLHRAVVAFQSGIVAALLQMGADASIPDDAGQTPLMIAKFSRPEIGSFKQAQYRMKIVAILTEHENRPTIPAVSSIPAVVVMSQSENGHESDSDDDDLEFSSVVSLKKPPEIVPPKPNKPKLNPLIKQIMRRSVFLPRLHSS